MKKKILTLLLCIGLLVGGQTTVFAKDENALRVLCYHDIPKTVSLDNFGVDQNTFVNTIEYFRTHGFHFVSLEDIRLSYEEKKQLPDKPILLTFDDAYLSYFEFVFPVLQEYNIPSVLSVVSSWIDSAPKDLKLPLMTWAQIKEVSQSPLVEIASHSENLHRGIIYNPQGNEDAAISRIFEAGKNTYEPDDIYFKRIKADIKKSKEVLENKLDIPIRTITWPYGKYNSLSMLAAKEEGLDINLVLNDQSPKALEWPLVQRFLIYRNPELIHLLRFLKIKPDDPQQQRIIQVDLDLIYDEDPLQIEINLGKLLDRVKEMRASTVYLQAFADPDGSGNIQSVYFPNRILPMRADLFSRVVHQLRSRTMVEVYAWMPMLSFILPNIEETHALRVCAYEKENIHPSQGFYQRLSPFSLQTQEKLYQLYSDMAQNAAIDGVLFQDDGYFNDLEDFHPDAQKEYLNIVDGKMKSPYELTPEESQRWTEVKTNQLLKLTTKLKEAVHFHRPQAKFARNLYAEVLLNPDSEKWWAQNYSLSLENYDYVVIMAYPFLEKERGSLTTWFQKLVNTAKEYPGGLNKTVFKIQAYDWQSNGWIAPKTLNLWLETLAKSGAQHLGYYPDDYTVDKPRADIIRRMISTEDFPFKRKYSEQDWIYKQ